MDLGIKSPNLTSTDVVDSVLSNRKGSTRQVAVAALAKQLAGTSPISLLGNQSPLFKTRTDLLAATLASKISAWVYDDTTVAYNGIWRWTGSAWEWSLPLPYSFINAVNVGAITPNAIQATTPIPVSDSALIILPVELTNTDSPVTVSFNGGSPLTIKTNSGSDPFAGGLPSGMIMIGVIAGSTFRLMNDPAVGAVAEQFATQAQNSATSSQTAAAAAAASAAHAEDIAVTFQGSRTLPFTGAVSRTLSVITQDWINVREFDVKHDGSDETSKFQNALNALSDHGGGALVVDGPINTSAEVTNYNGVHIMCTSRQRVEIVSSATNVPIVRMGGTKSRISGVTLRYLNTPVAGASALKFTGPVNSFEDIFVVNAYRGIEQLANDIIGRNFRVENCIQIPLHIQGAIQGGYSDFVLYGDVASGKSSISNIRLQGQVESIKFVNGEILGGVRSITTDAPALANTQCPAYCDFTSVKFDGASSSSQINNALKLKFMGCWWSGGRESVDNGLQLLATKGLEFSANAFVNCGLNGMDVTNQTTGLKVVGGDSWDNGASPGTPGLIAGIRFEDGCHHYDVQGFSGANGLVTPYSGWSGKQTHAVVVGASNHHFLVNARDYGGITAAVSQFTSASATEVYNNCF